MLTRRDLTTFEEKEDFRTLVDMRAVYGGSDPARFAPNLNLSWSAFSGRERLFLNLNRASVTVARQPLEFDLTKRVVFESSALERDIFHQRADRSLAWDVVLLQKPASNRFEWSLTHSPDLVFYKQRTSNAGRSIQANEIRPEVA